MPLKSEGGLGTPRKWKIRTWFSAGASLILFSNCGTPPVVKVLTLSEQIEVDTKSAEGLARQFKNEITFLSTGSQERYLNSIVKNLLGKRAGLENEKIEVKILDDDDPKFRELFSFPGMTIFIPASFVKKVQFENELAAGLAFEVADLLNRALAKRVEKASASGVKPVIFGSPSVFDLSQEERLAIIRLASALMIDANYDIRGMASIFKRYPSYYVRDATSDLFQKAVAFNLREAQRAKSEYLPQMDPIVRSPEFIQFKKEFHAEP